MTPVLRERLAVVLAALLSVAGAAFATGDEPVIEVLAVSHGWHTGVVLPAVAPTARSDS